MHIHTGLSTVQVNCALVKSFGLRHLPIVGTGQSASSVGIRQALPGTVVLIVGNLTCCEVSQYAFYLVRLWR